MVNHRSNSRGSIPECHAIDDACQEEAVTNIKVAVRCRPMSAVEEARGEHSCFRIENGTASLENPANPSDVHRCGTCARAMSFVCAYQSTARNVLYQALGTTRTLLPYCSNTAALSKLQCSSLAAPCDIHDFPKKFMEEALFAGSQRRRRKMCSLCNTHR